MNEHRFKDKILLQPFGLVVQRGFFFFAHQIVSLLHLHGKVITAMDLNDLVCFLFFFNNKDMWGMELVQLQEEATLKKKNF